MFVAYLLKGVLIAIYVAYWSVQMGPASTFMADTCLGPGLGHAPCAVAVSQRS